MKKGLLGSLLFIGATCLTACNPKEYNKAIDHLKKHLKDPESLMVLSGESHANPKEKRCTFRLYYNAKNSFGGYGSAEYVYILCKGGSVDSCSYCEILEGNAAFYYKLDAGIKDTTLKTK